MDSLLQTIKHGMAVQDARPVKWLYHPNAEGFWWARTPAGALTVVRAILNCGEYLVTFIGSTTDHDLHSIGPSCYEFSRIAEPAE